MSGEGKFFTTLGADVETIIPGGIKFDSATSIYLTDAAGNAVFAIGTTVPGDVAGYAKGCLFVDTDVADGTTGLYVNVGTITSADFEAVTSS